MRLSFFSFLYWVVFQFLPAPGKMIDPPPGKTDYYSGRTDPGNKRGCCKTDTGNVNPGKAVKMNEMTDTRYTYLALGDSYTIGTGVSIYETYPYQTVQILRKSGYPVSAPEIMARNGWTSGELIEALKGNHFLPPYELVSLLIGVNNEYRGQNARAYEKEFEQLLKQCIHLAGDRPGRVFVLSIPDWSVTPFGQNSLPDAAGRDQKKVAAEIDAFNGINRNIADLYRVNYLDITPHTRIAGKDPSCLATDFLHPSGKEYGTWSGALADLMAGKLDQ
ncbi:MAG: GDSL-type esterase/lipase family protein [Puia sp.]|nr:GDSL-type esterase/lipase family protein [Puia sp.]